MTRRGHGARGAGAAAVAGRRGDTEFVLVSYDIADDRRRARVHRLLSGFGAWVQYSVFECYLTNRQQVELAARLAREIAPTEDHVRLYRLCHACEGRVEVTGGGRPAEAVAYVV